MASIEVQHIRKMVRDLATATSFQEKYLLRCVASLRLNKNECDITMDDINAEYNIIGLQMGSTSHKNIQSIKVLHNELGLCAENLSQKLSRLQDEYEDRKNYDRQKIWEFSSELEVEKAFAEKDKADLQAMIETTKAAAAKEVQRLLEENARSNAQIEALSAQNMELEKEATKNAGIIESPAREIARLEEQVTGIRVAAAAAAGGEEADDEPGTLTLPFVLEDGEVFRYATKEEMAGKIDQKLVEAQKKPVREYFEELRKESEGEYDASDEDEESDAGESVVSVDGEGVEVDDWSVLSVE